MKYNDYKLKGDSRSNQRAKRRKTNLILNSLIAIVLLLIVFVSITIFFSDGEDSTSQNNNTELTKSNGENINPNDMDQSDESSSNEQVEEASGDSTEVEDTSSDTDVENDDSVTDDGDTAEEAVSEDVVIEGGTDPNVKTTITNPNWQPVGTSQSGEHFPNYDGNSADWQEMMRAISYGTGLEENNMTVWFLGNNGTNQSVGTISSKDQSVIYRVFIEWVDGLGWKPIKVEELIENDRR
jgi:cytoskeletal protein RodZ